MTYINPKQWLLNIINLVIGGLIIGAGILSFVYHTQTKKAEEVAKQKSAYSLKVYKHNRTIVDSLDRIFDRVELLRMVVNNCDVRESLIKWQVITFRIKDDSLLYKEVATYANDLYLSAYLLQKYADTDKRLPNKREYYNLTSTLKWAECRLSQVLSIGCMFDKKYGPNPIDCYDYK